MRIKNNHTAYSLLLLLFFPLFGQGLHQLIMHHEDHHDSHANISGISNIQDHNECLVCDYEFAHFCSSEIAKVSRIYPLLIAQLSLLPQLHLTFYNGYHTLLRGPPNSI